MDSEFETEQAEPKRRLDELIVAAKDLLRHVHLNDHSVFDGKNLDTTDLAQDQVAFLEQERQLDGRPGLVVELEDKEAISGATRVAVPVDLGLRKADRLDRIIQVTASRLIDAGFKVLAAKRNEARNAFVERVAETLALRAFAHNGYSHAPPSDTVSSTNHGDDILCAKGWFLSTGLIVGQSICTLSRKPGRYSLGVCHLGQTSYHPQLFNLPLGQPIHLKLP